jgi:predicted DNA-binding transcriptional regulator AlpA
VLTSRLSMSTTSQLSTSRTSQVPTVNLVEELVGVAEIREMLGGTLSRQRVHVITGRREFPAPVQKLKMGHVWLKRDVEEWIKQRQGKEQ